MPTEDQNTRDLNQKYDDLQNKIADILLGPDSPVRGSAGFDRLISEHDHLLSRQDELKELEKKLTEVLPGLEQAEGSLDIAQKQLAAEKKKLVAYAGELGQAAFAGLRSGELPDHQIFSDRKELQSRIENLQRQRSELTADANAGLMDKAKLQAQQLKLKGQIKIEELRINSVDRAIGEAILKTKEKIPVRCDKTEKVLKTIIHQREQIVKARDQVKQAENSKADRKSATAQTLGRSTVNDASSLKSELKEVRKKHRHNEKSITEIRKSMITQAIETESLGEDAIVGEKIKEFWSLNFNLQSSKPQAIKLATEGLARFKRLPPKLQYGSYGAAAVAFLLLALMSFGGGKPDESLSVNEDFVTKATGQEISEAIKAVTALGGKAKHNTNGGLAVFMPITITDRDIETLQGLTAIRSLNMNRKDKNAWSPNRRTEYKKSLPLITRDGFQMLSSMKNLRHLDLSFNDDVNDQALELLCSLPFLESLILQNTNVGDRGAESIGRATRLKSLDLENTKVTDSGVAYLASLTSLETLDLSRTNVTGNCLRSLGKLPELNSLDLSMVQISESQTASLELLRDIELLNLSHCGLSDLGIKHLSALTNLHELDLSGNREIDGSGLVCLHQMKKLRAFNLNQDKPPLSRGYSPGRLSDVGLSYLADRTTLEELDLRNTAISDGGLSYLSGLTNLQVLSLADTRISDTGLKYLAELSELRILDLSKPSLSVYESNPPMITDRGLKQLTQLSKLQMLNLIGTGQKLSRVKYSGKRLKGLDEVQTFLTKIGPVSSGRFSYQIGNKVFQGRVEMDKYAKKIEHVFLDADRDVISIVMDNEKSLISTTVLGVSNGRLHAGQGKENIHLFFNFYVLDRDGTPSLDGKPDHGVRGSLQAIYVMPGPVYDSHWFGKRASQVPAEQQEIFIKNRAVPVIGFGIPSKVESESQRDVITYADFSPANQLANFRKYLDDPDLRLVIGSRILEVDESARRLLFLYERGVAVMRYRKGARDFESRQSFGD